MDRSPVADLPTSQDASRPAIVMEGATLVGTPGFFRVGRSTKGRWWLVRPDGRPMFHQACCALWMPDEGGGLEALRFRKRFEAENGGVASLPRHCFSILADRGFNALGAWCTERFWNQGWPFSLLIPTREVHAPALITSTLLDVFDPAWLAAYEKACARVCPRLADSRDLIGYFVDNEGGWYTARRDFVWGQDQGPMVDRQVLGQAALLLQMFLAADPRHPGQAFAWRWALERHGGSLARLSADWGSDFAGEDEFRQRTNSGLALSSAGYRKDHEAFTDLYVRTYHRLTAEAIRRHDPNHLMLGVRYGGTPGDEVLRSLDPRHLDVVSWNCYNLGFAQRVEEMYRVTRLPQINGEYAWASGGFLNWDKFQARELFSDGEMARCRRLGQAVLEEAVAHPALIGYTWYKFCANPPDPDQPGVGLIDEWGSECRFTSALLRKVNARLERIALGEIAPATREEPVL